MAEYKNGVAPDVGVVRRHGHNGDRVLFAYAAFGDKVLALSGPASAKPRRDVTLKVTDAATGAAVAGATVGAARQRGATAPSPPGRGATRASTTCKAEQTGVRALEPRPRR